MIDDWTVISNVTCFFYKLYRINLQNNNKIFVSLIMGSQWMTKWIGNYWESAVVTRHTVQWLTNINNLCITNDLVCVSQYHANVFYPVRSYSSPKIMVCIKPAFHAGIPRTSVEASLSVDNLGSTQLSVALLYFMDDHSAENTSHGWQTNPILRWKKNTGRLPVYVYRVYHTASTTHDCLPSLNRCSIWSHCNVITMRELDNSTSQNYTLPDSPITLLIKCIKVLEPSSILLTCVQSTNHSPNRCFVISIPCIVMSYI